MPVTFETQFGIETVGLEVFPLSIVDSTVELLRLANRGADWVYCSTVAGTTVVIMKDAARLGLGGKGIKFCNYIGMIGKSEIEMAGVSVNSNPSCVFTTVLVVISVH